MNFFTATPLFYHRNGSVSLSVSESIRLRHTQGNTTLASDTLRETLPSIRLRHTQGNTTWKRP